MTGLEVAALGAAATGTAGAAGATAATAGLFGTGGAFSLGTTLGTLGTVGTILGGASTIMGGGEAEAAAKQQSAQLKANAIAEGATAQRQAINERQKARLLQSRVTALTAAGGGDTTDAGTQDILSDLENQGEYNALTALWNGDDRAAGLRSQANATMYEGKATKRSSYAKGAGTILSGGQSLYDKFGGAYA
jgi:hypothetical protein